MQEIEFTKYKERGACHWAEAKHSIREFNAHQEARFEWILKCSGNIKDNTVLDVGCGDGALTYRIVEKGANVIGIDNSEEGIKLAEEIFNKKQVLTQFILADAYKMPIKSNSIDCVILSEVIEHVAKPQKLLSETQRVLKKKGKVVISTPYRLGEIPWDKFHTREYYPGELKSLLAEYFSDVKIIETHPVFWTFLYDFGIPWFRRRKVFRWFINIAVLYLGIRNPFLGDDSHRRRFDYFTQIMAVACKK